MLSVLSRGRVDREVVELRRSVGGPTEQERLFVRNLDGESKERLAKMIEVRSRHIKNGGSDIFERVFERFVTERESFPSRIGEDR